jgi:quercetin dioxygenase-like cupin family protein
VPFDRLDGVAPQQLADGYLARAVHGEQLTLGVVEIEPDAALPEHSHANEQFGIVISGSVEFTIDGETETLGPGGIWRIPGGAPHRVVGGPEGATVIDVFAPPRAEWQSLGAQEPRPARWR